MKVYVKAVLCTALMLAAGACAQKKSSNKGASNTTNTTPYTYTPTTPTTPSIVTPTYLVGQNCTSTLSMQKKIIIINQDQLMMQIRYDDGFSSTSTYTSTILNNTQNYGTTTAPEDYSLVLKSSASFYRVYTVTPRNSSLNTGSTTGPTITLYGTQRGLEKTVFFNKVPYNQKQLYGLYGCK